MYKAVISDLDGTLLNGQHRISDFTRSTLNKLVSRGVKFIVATGRHHVDAQSVCQSLGVEYELITLNGALAFSADGSIVYQRSLKPEMAEEVVRITSGNLAYAANIYKYDGWYVPRELPDQLEYYIESGFKYVVSDFAKIDMGGIHKFCFTGDHNALVKLELDLIDRFSGQANIVFSRADCLELVPANVNKGAAAAAALESSEIGVGDAVAFGDGMNDVEMLSMAAMGFVMDNASDSLKRSLPGNPRAGHCDKDGVADQLIKIFGL